MITTHLAGRLKPEARERYRNTAIGAIGLDRWYTLVAGRGRADVVFLEHFNDIMVPLADMDYASTVFRINYVYYFDGTSRSLFAQHLLTWGFPADSQLPEKFECAGASLQDSRPAVFGANLPGHLPFHVPVPPKNDTGVYFTEPAQVALIVRDLCLSGWPVMVSGLANYERMGDSIENWCRYGGLLMGTYGRNAPPIAVNICGRAIAVANVQHAPIPEELLLTGGLSVVIRSCFRLNRRIDYHYDPAPPPVRAVGRVFNSQINNRSNAVASFDCGPKEYNWHELRCLSPDELAYVTAERAKVKLTQQQIEGFLGQTLCDCLRQYPASIITRGMLFSRTEVQITDEHKDYDAIMKRLLENPGLLVDAVPGPPLIIPHEMYEAGEKWYRERLGLPPMPKPKVEKLNPLQMLDDSDRILVKFMTEITEEQRTTQSRVSKYESNHRVPASVAKEGLDAIRGYIEGMSSGDLNYGKRLSEGEWENIISGSREEVGFRVHTIDLGPLQKYVPTDS